MTIVRNVIEYLQILYDFPASQAAVIMAVTAFLYFLGCAAVPGLKKKMTKAGAVSGLLLSFYISQVIGITILNRNMTEEARYDLNLMDVYRIALNGNEVFFTQLLGNVLMFIPLGILMPVCFEKVRGFIRILILSFFCSSFIETTQLLTHTGLFELVDLINNTLGGCIGYLIFKISYGIIRLNKKQKKRSR